MRRSLGPSLVLVLLIASCGDEDRGKVVADTADTTPVDATVFDTAIDVSLDTSSPDAPDTNVSCDEDPSGFLCACRQNEDCNSGFCVPSSLGGKVCTKYCITECPDGWECSLVQIPGGDPTFLCLEIGVNLCRPCTSDDECRAGSFGASADRCVSWGGRTGSFCGMACAAPEDCPTGYTCETVTALSDGAETKQCVPTDERECTCSPRAVAEGASTVCADETCAGLRRCTEDGLTACDAPAWDVESCNGRDDDCDGQTDEGFDDTDADRLADCVDPDDDDDSVLDEADNCPLTPNPEQTDTDLDLDGDACDADDDNDGILDPDDNCPLVANFDQTDTDGDGTGDACDTTAPLPPELTGTDPASPSNVLTPAVLGTTEPHAAVTFYADPDCAGEPVGSGEADADGDIAAPVTVRADTTTTLYATATDASGNTSECSPEPVVYVHDGTPPDAPVLTATDPASPTRSGLTPTVEGTVAEAALVRLYAFSCAGAPLGTVTTTGATTFEIVGRAFPNTTTYFVAEALDPAGNVSACSEPFAYVHDDIRPPPPTITASTPASPSNTSTTPELTGTAETGTTVAIYTTACTGTPVATTSAATGAFAVIAEAGANATTTFRATATDGAGNVSDCSAPFQYTHNTRVPDPPVIVSSTPPSPSRTSTRPTLSGTSELGTVRLYTQPECGGAVITTATVATGTAFSAALDVRPNDTTVITADLRDAAGNVSACSAPFQYTHDDRAPAAPVLLATDPTSPSATELSPLVSGTSEPAATITLYGAANCQGAPLATTLAEDGAFAVAVTVLPNRTTQLSATARDEAGNVSACSDPLPYTHDATAPSPPTLTHTTPASPSSTITTPTVHGTAEARAQISLYLDAACTQPAAAGTTAADGRFAIAATVAEDATTTFYATATDQAGNTSTCAGPLPYTHDSQAPATPKITSSLPASPSSTSVNPVLSGSTDAFTTVAIHTDPSCLSAALATAGAVGQTFFATVSLTPNTTRTFYARATDQAGNASGCSEGFAYTHDNLAPAAPDLTGTTPASPSSQTTTPFLDGSAEALATIRVFTNATCAGTPVATLADNPGAFSVQVPAAQNTTTTFYATATDAAGNTSPCSSGEPFTHDATAPAAPVLTRFDPAALSRTSTTPTLVGTTEANTTLTVYTTANCSGPILTTLASSPASFSLQLTLPANATTPVSAKATDRAGNTSACSNTLSFTHDDRAPAAPVLTATTPTSPSRTSTNPTLAGTAEAASTVRVYDNATCSGTALATTTATAQAAFSTAAAALANATRTFYATATDAAGNTSPCSAGLPYTHDDKAPAAPIWTGSDPASPSRTSTTPRLSGTAEANARVTLYATANCSGTAIATLDLSGTDFSSLVTAQPNQTTSFTATATDAAGNVSPCSAAFAYVHDNVAPATPTLTSTTPPSPSNSNLNPVVNGTADAGTTVRLYTNASCTDPSIGNAATANPGFAIAVTVTANTTTTFYAKAFDAAGNASGCSTGLAYSHDNLGGDTPRITGSNPTSPSRTSTTPSLLGTAEAGATVRIYTTSNCTGAVSGTGTATNGAFTIQVAAGANTTTTFFAQATDVANNVSACSAGFAYTHDNTKPNRPVLTATNPISPARSTSPTVSGTAEANTSVRLFTNATCTTQNGSAATATGGAFGIVATVGANATTTFYANATDAAGNVSDCSDPLTYVSDNTAPAAPVWVRTSPTSPSNSITTPRLFGTSEVAATVKIYASTTCSGTAVATVGPLGVTGFDAEVTVSANTTASFTATATDAAGNTSACSAVITYTHDNQAPPTPTLTGTSPTSPNNSSTSPSVQGTISQAGHTIEVFTNGTCTGTAAATLASATTTFAIPTTVSANTTTTLSARAKDAAGNTSACSNTLTYRHDAQAPAAPTITTSTPTSPSRTSTTPTLTGTAEASSAIQIFTSSTCTGTALGTATTSAAGAFTTTAVNATANATTTFYARAIDQAGNASPCSTGFAYTHDSLAPNTPVLTGTSPTSPSNASTTPTVNGTVAVSGLTVRLFKTADCTGTGADTVNAPTTFAIGTSVTGNTTTSFTAVAIDAAGNVSACSNAVTFTHDNLAPTKPVLTGTNPTSPSRTSTTPQVLGTTAEAGLTVRVYTLASCTGTPIATGPATASGGGGAFAIASGATANATTTFYASAIDAAGNLSACSNGLGYTHDNTAPPAPVLTAFTPASPSTTNANTTAAGTEGDATSSVFLYPSTNCSGTAINTAGTVATGGVFSIGFPATNLGCTPVSAKAVDPAGNTSACSNSLTFAHYGCAQCLCTTADWVRQHGTTASDGATSVAIDLNGNALQVGNTQGALGGQTHAGGVDAFLLKRSSTGNLVWTRQLGTATWDTANAVAVDPSGNIYVAGGTDGDLNGSGVPVPTCDRTDTNSPMCSDIWVAKYDTNGTRAWINRYSSARREWATDLEWDTNGNRLLLLATTGTQQYGSGLSPQVFAVNASTGAMTQVWAYIEDSANKNPGGLGVDTSGNFYVHGRAQWAITGALSTTGSGGNGVNYLYKVASNGTQTWLQHWGSAAHDIAYDVIADASGNVFAAGFLQGAPEGTGATGGPYRGANATEWSGWGDAALARFSSAGAQQWARIFGTPLDDLITTVRISDGVLRVAGMTKGNAVTGTNTSLYGGIDLFVATFNLDGTVPASNTRQLGSANHDTIGRAALSNGVWYLSGATSGDWTGHSRDACTFQGVNDILLGRFCLSSGVIEQPPAR